MNYSSVKLAQLYAFCIQLITLTPYALRCTPNAYRALYYKAEVKT